MELKKPKKGGILSNNKYNLMAQLTEENKSLWRIKNKYMKDPAGDEEAKQFWEYLEKDKQDHIKRLTELVAKRVQVC